MPGGQVPDSPAPAGQKPGAPVVDRPMLDEFDASPAPARTAPAAAPAAGAAPVFPAPHAGRPWPAGEPLLVSADGWLYRSASGLSTAFTILSAIAVVLSGVSLLVAASVTEDDWERVDSAINWLGGAGICTIVSSIILVAWTRRVTGNLKPFGAGLELGTGWAVGAFFVPIINLWFPVRLWNQAWRATSLHLTPPIGWAWKGLPASHLHWVTHVLTWVLIVADRRYPRDLDATTDDWASYLVIVSVLMIVVHVLRILLVRNLTARQDTYARYWSSAAVPPPVPAREA